jgi:hypothetical protein
MPSVVPTDAHAPIHRQRHDQNEPLQPVGMLQLRGLEIETAALEVGERRLSGKGLAR